MLSFQPAFAFEYTLALVPLMIDIAIALALLAATESAVFNLESRCCHDPDKEYYSIIGVQRYFSLLRWID